MESVKIGGTCLNRGCMPTKALLHSAEVYHLATSSAGIGILGRDVGVDWERVQSNRQSVSDRLTGGVAALMRANKIKVLDGRAEFTGPKTVAVNGETLTADKIIIAVGSKPNMPPVPGLKDSKAALDSTGALTLDHIPESLAVIGGGVIGLELGSVYMRFGAKVTVIEMLPKLLPPHGRGAHRHGAGPARGGGHGDTDGLVRRLRARHGRRRGAHRQNARRRAQDSGREDTRQHPAAPRSPRASASRRPGIKTDRAISSRTSAYATNVEGVYAVGDCTGKLMLAHAAMAMGEAAA